jgi:hypothetical protein
VWLGKWGKLVNKGEWDDGYQHRSLVTGFRVNCRALGVPIVWTIDERLLDQRITLADSDRVKTCQATIEAIPWMFVASMTIGIAA